MPIKNISSRNNVSLDNICYLVATSITNDSSGNQIETDTKQMCFCSEMPITFAEFSKAGQAGFKSERLLVVNSESYNDEQYVEYDSVKYAVYRVYSREDGHTELYLADRVGV